MCRVMAHTNLASPAQQHTGACYVFDETEARILGHPTRHVGKGRPNHGSIIYAIARDRFMN